jgi:site-specific DNA-methyltransferase (adenine-specific)
LTLPPHVLHHADALALCEAQAGAAPFDLVYLDPPFAVGGGVMASRDGAGQGRGRKSAVSGREAYRDVADVATLVGYLERLFAALRERMSDRATLYLHMDYRAIHEAKVAADRVFGPRAFLGEVVWAPGNGARGARGFSVTHQNILLYAKADKRRAVWRSDHPLLREPYADTSLSMHFTSVDADGRRYRERVIRGKSYRYYADEGRRLGSVWSDIPAMVANTPLMQEGTGYPTQKPEKLLERIIRAATHEGDTVCDPMCGSGTTLVVAHRLGRRFVGSDIGAVAIETARARLKKAGVPYRFSELGTRN